MFAIFSLEDGLRDGLYAQPGHNNHRTIQLTAETVQTVMDYTHSLDIIITAPFN